MYFGKMKLNIVGKFILSKDLDIEVLYPCSCLFISFYASSVILILLMHMTSICFNKTVIFIHGNNRKKYFCFVIHI